MTAQLKARALLQARGGLVLVAFAWGSGASAPATAVEVAPAVAPRSPIPLRLESVDFPAQQLQTAVDAWRHGCGGALGVRLPDIVFEGPGVPVIVRRRADSSSHNGRCGLTTL